LATTLASDDRGIVRALSDIDPGSHLVLIYDSPEHKRDVLFSHLALGAKDSKLVYVCSEEPPDQVEEEMSEFGINVAWLKTTGRLTIAEYDQVYLEDGKVDVPKAIGYFSNLAWSCWREGVGGGLRVAEEMSFFFRRRLVDDLKMYEKRLHRTFPFESRGVCAYSVVDLAGSGRLEDLLGAFHRRDAVAFTGPNGVSILDQEPLQKPVKSTEVSSGGLQSQYFRH